jgi:Helix-turn-helix domain
MANQPVLGTIIAKLKLRTSYLTTTEVMEIIPRTRKTLCAMVKAGDIPAIRCGRDNMFEPWHLALWLEDRQLGGRPHASGKHERTSDRQGSKAGAGGRYPDAAKPHPLY